MYSRHSSLELVVNSLLRGSNYFRFVTERGLLPFKKTINVSSSFPSLELVHSGQSTNVVLKKYKLSLSEYLTFKKRETTRDRISINAANVGSTRDLISQKKTNKQTKT